MKIIIGSGRTRKVYELPHGSVFKRASDKEVAPVVANVCDMLGIK